MKIKASNILILSCFFLQLHAQTVYIKAGKVFDGNQILNDRVIAISNGLIEGIFESTKAIPGSSGIIDASDCTVLPGLIDSHIHFMGAPLISYQKIDKAMANGKITGPELNYPVVLTITLLKMEKGEDSIKSTTLD